MLLLALPEIDVTFGCYHGLHNDDSRKLGEQMMNLLISTAILFFITIVVLSAPSTCLLIAALIRSAQLSRAEEIRRKTHMI